MAIPKAYFKSAAKIFDPTRIYEKPEALRGIRVLELSVSTARALSDRARDSVDAKRYSGVAYRLSGSLHTRRSHRE